MQVIEQERELLLESFMTIGQGLTRESGDEEALAVATSSLLTIMEYINGLIDNYQFKEKEDQEDQENK